VRGTTVAGAPGAAGGARTPARSRCRRASAIQASGRWFGRLLVGTAVALLDGLEDGSTGILRGAGVDRHDHPEVIARPEHVPGAEPLRPAEQRPALDLFPPREFLPLPGSR